MTEAISVDMGCVGDGLGCKETQVSICAKDSGGPYHYDVVSGLIAAARRAGADFAVDVYPHYGSDVEATLSAGHDLRHGLIGPGVYASHGYERSHVEGGGEHPEAAGGLLERVMVSTIRCSETVKKASQSSRPQARRNCDLFSAATCAWTKTLLGPANVRIVRFGGQCVRCGGP